MGYRIEFFGGSMEVTRLTKPARHRCPRLMERETDLSSQKIH